MKKTDSKNARVVKTRNGNIMHLPNCEVCSSQKTRFAKEQQAIGLLDTLVRYVSKILLVDLVLY